MTDLIKKYNLLDTASQKELLDFMNFLLNKNVKSPKKMADYKKKILNVSVWNNEDIDFIPNGWNYIRKNDKK